MRCEKTSSRVHSVIVTRKSILQAQNPRPSAAAQSLPHFQWIIRKIQGERVPVGKWNFSLSFLLLFINIYGHSCFFFLNNPEVNAVISAPFFQLPGPIIHHLMPCPEKQKFQIYLFIKHQMRMYICFNLVLRRLKKYFHFW